MLPDGLTALYKFWLSDWLYDNDMIDLRPCQHDNGYMDGRSQIKVHIDERTQVHSAQSSLAVIHPGTNRARRNLTSVTESPSKHWSPWVSDWCDYRVCNIRLRSLRLWWQIIYTLAYLLRRGTIRAMLMCDGLKVWHNENWTLWYNSWKVH